MRKRCLGQGIELFYGVEMIEIKENLVRKRDGSFEPLDYDKIHTMLEWCSNGLNIGFLQNHHDLFYFVRIRFPLYVQKTDSYIHPHI